MPRPATSFGNSSPGVGWLLLLKNSTLTSCVFPARTRRSAHTILRRLLGWSDRGGWGRRGVAHTILHGPSGPCASTCGCKRHAMDFRNDHTSSCTAHSGATKAHDWFVGVLALSSACWTHGPHPARSVFRLFILKVTGPKPFTGLNRRAPKRRPTRTLPP